MGREANLRCQQKEGVSVSRIITMRKAGMTVALVIFVVSAQYALVKEDPTAGPISAVALYALLVLSIVSRLAGGSATIPSRPAPVSYRRGPGEWYRARISFWCALLAASALALCALLMKDLTPVGWAFGFVLGGVLVPLLVYGVFDVVAISHCGRLAPTIGRSPQGHSRPRRWRSPVAAISVLGLLMLYAFFAFKSVWAVLGILAMFIALCLLLFALYGVHRFFQLVQSRGTSLLSWPPRKRSKWHKIAIWIPSAVALVTLLFEPLTCAVVAHLRHGRTEGLSHYRIRIPWNWWLCGREDEGEGRREFGLLSGRGIAQGGLGLYLIGRPPLSGAVFSNYGYDAALEDERQFKQPADEGGGRISVRQFQVGDALMTCREYLPRDRWWWVVRKNPPLWEVDCLTTRESGAGDLSASFIGQKEDVPSFYRIIDRIEKAD